jgi:predicted lysophospholipase L1 biosynthesis ABC-type transport system permease subunit
MSRQYVIDVTIFFGSFVLMFVLAALLGRLHGWWQHRQSERMRTLRARVALARLIESGTRTTWDDR